MGRDVGASGDAYKLTGSAKYLAGIVLYRPLNEGYYCQSNIEQSVAWDKRCTGPSDAVHWPAQVVFYVIPASVVPIPSTVIERARILQL